MSVNMYTSVAVSKKNERRLVTASGCVDLILISKDSQC